MMRTRPLRTALVLIAVLTVGSVGLGTASSAEPRLGGPFPMPTEMSVTPSRTTAASGQAIRFTGTATPCKQFAHPVEVSLFKGASPDFVTDYPVAVGDAEADGSGNFEVALGLLNNTGGASRYAPLAEGPYVAVAWCSDGTKYIQSDTHAITVDGVMPSEDLDDTVARWYGVIDLVGGSCFETLTLDLWGWGSEIDGDEQEAHEVIQPEADGSWTFHWEGKTLGSIFVQATCGDDLADGFRYRLVIAEIVYFIPPTTTTSTTPTSTSSTSSTTLPAGTGPGEATPAVPVSGTPTLTG